MHRLQGQWYLGEMLLAAVRFQGWWRVLDGHQQYLHGRQLGKWGMAMCQLQNGDSKGPDVSQAVVSGRHSRLVYQPLAPELILSGKPLIPTAWQPRQLLHVLHQVFTHWLGSISSSSISP